MKTKIVAALLALVTVFCLGGCQSSKTDDSAAQTEAVLTTDAETKTNETTENTNPDAELDPSIVALKGTWCESGIVYHKLTIDEKGNFTLDALTTKQLERVGEGFIALTEDENVFYAISDDNSFKLSLNDDGTMTFSDKYILENLG